MAPRPTASVLPHLREGEVARRVIGNLFYTYRYLLWVKWLKFRWRIERRLISHLAVDLYARGVPRGILNLVLPLKGQYLSGMLVHGDPMFYFKRHENALESSIIEALEQCPESRLYRGGGGTIPRRQYARIEREALSKIRAALASDAELAEALREFL